MMTELNLRVVGPGNLVSNNPGSGRSGLANIRRSPDGSLEYRTGEGEKAEWRFLCSPLWVRGLTRGADSDNWGRLLEIKDPDDHVHRWSMPASTLATSYRESYRERLYELGCRIGPGPQAARALHEYLSAIHDLDGNELPRILAASRIGWHGEAFVLPSQSIGGNGEVFQSGSSFRAAIRSSGTLDDWQRSVASLAEGNSRLVLAMSAAFSAPLLGPLRCEGAILHLRGASSTGKSTILDVAGSVWGGGGLNGYRQSWQATANGIEAMAEAHCDVLLCLDELGLINPEDAARIAYQLTSGTGKQRAQASGAGAMRHEWRAFALSTGEIGLADKLREARTLQRRMPGQAVRMIDVPADAGKGLGCFDNVPILPGRVDGVTAKERGGSFARLLSEASRLNYGFAGPAFVRAFITDGEASEARARQIIQQFMDSLEPGADGQVQRVAQRFGLVAAAGELAITYGVVPWTAGTAFSAAKACFSAWLDARGDSGPSEIADAIAHLQATIERDEASRFQWIRNGRVMNSSVEKRWGFCRASEEYDREYLFFPRMWQELMAGRDIKLIERELVDREILKSEGGNRRNSKERVPGYKNSLRVFVVRHSKLFDTSVEERNAG